MRPRSKPSLQPTASLGDGHLAWETWATRILPAMMAFLLATIVTPRSPAQSQSPAELALQQGRADEATRLLKATLAQDPGDTRAHQLLCRVFLSEEMADPAIAQCEQAAAQQPNGSDNQMWMGRAYGQKAEKAGPFSGLSLAKKVHAAFERAVELDPANRPAAAALGEFYVAAPSLVGGGLDKAQRLAAQLEPRFPAEAHHLRALIAEKSKDYPAAEVELRLALAAKRTPENWVDLGNFYQHRNQPDKAAEALQSAIEADPNRDAALADVAGILTAANRNPELAEKVLRLYLASPGKSEAAPAFKVHVQLGRLLAQRGDAAGAREQYTAALQLASGYTPARKALGRL